MLPPLLCAVLPEFIDLLFGSFGTFFLYTSTMAFMTYKLSRLFAGLRILDIIVVKNDYYEGMAL